MPNVRGRALLVRAQFVEERCGSGAWARLLDGLPQPARKTLAAVEPTGWYPMEMYGLVQEAALRMVGGEPAVVLAEMGAYSAEKNVEAIFGKLSGDAFEFFKHIAKLHRELFDFGEMTVVRRPGGCLIEIDYIGRASRSVCKSAVGFYRRCAELNGARNVHVEMIECQADGDGSCLFKLSWKKIRRTITSPPRPKS